MKTKTKLKRENRKRLKTKTKMPRQQNLPLNESASIQYGAHGCYDSTASVSYTHLTLPTNREV